jgi:hypothetical protein
VCAQGALPVLKLQCWHCYWAAVSSGMSEQRWVGPLLEGLSQEGQPLPPRYGLWSGMPLDQTVQMVVLWLILWNL